MKARLKWHRRLYWWWKVRHYELDPGKTATFWEWLNAHDLMICEWQTFGETFEDHDHKLVELSMEHAEAVLQRYLRNVKKIYGDPVAGDKGNNTMYS